MKVLFIKWWETILATLSYPKASLLEFIVLVFWTFVFLFSWGMVYKYSGINNWSTDDLYLFFGIYYLVVAFFGGLWLPKIDEFENYMLKPKGLLLMTLMRFGEDSRSAVYILNNLLFGVFFFFLSSYPFLEKMFCLFLAVLVYNAYKILVFSLGLYFRIVSPLYYDNMLLLYYRAFSYPNKEVPPFVRAFFTFCVPAFLTAVTPIDLLKGLENWEILIFVFVFLAVSLIFWNKGLERYQGIS